MGKVKSARYLQIESRNKSLRAEVKDAKGYINRLKAEVKQLKKDRRDVKLLYAPVREVIEAWESGNQEGFNMYIADLANLFDELGGWDERVDPEWNKFREWRRGNAVARRPYKNTHEIELTQMPKPVETPKEAVAEKFYSRDYVADLEFL